MIFETGAGLQTAQVVYFPSKTMHRLEAGFICSIYFDPLAPSLPAALSRKLGNSSHPLSLEDLPESLACIDASTDLGALLNSDFFIPRTLNSPDTRLERVLKEIKNRLPDGKDIDRNSLADIAHLSPTRFSHWFVERTGVPLRSYRKWLKLRVAVDAVLEGRNPMEAATLAGFSDLAHMSRAFSESFGFTYMDALRAWERSNKL
ncbi:helix-turn-helix domain-containing protein [Marinobacter nauticus]|uniref:helix-turn-helix domain-containing protein n=1 Tax=Marinobacter nauticus TaxID=2743 RepID=UPI001C9631E7|nr:AraC family transcriptional regulator [Marinobacter nauticus]MBY5938883.1 AraC family transcriptional regulator [Marinobacter nauticus]MBY5956112.1 AraC family transcriptional regulator [Marinobacter nauticus]MBY6009903.1 AraC family transcriptional regulator [Marinobacter nauticus]MBY6104830.1 AraC family transcriptional regulator [Marinobacter nauticus]